jgi:DNA-directed RNA polymerase subunit RPC12/RpoP
MAARKYLVKYFGLCATCGVKIERVKPDANLNRCRNCSQKIYLARRKERNPDRVRLLQRARWHEWKERNKEKEAERLRQYFQNNKDQYRKVQKRWRAQNKPMLAAKSQRRRAYKDRRTPSWADHEAIAMFFEMARRVSQCTGIPHHVDHIIPLYGRNVCGLHVESNLRVIPKTLNLRKGNKFSDGDSGHTKCRIG